jgi:hypothetical protein
MRTSDIFGPRDPDSAQGYGKVSKAAKDVVRRPGNNAKRVAFISKPAYMRKVGRS